MIGLLTREATVLAETTSAKLSLLEPSTDLDEASANFCLGLLRQSMAGGAQSGLVLSYVAYTACLLGGLVAFYGALTAIGVIPLRQEVIWAICLSVLVVLYFALTILAAAFPGNSKTVNRASWGITLAFVVSILLPQDVRYALACIGLILVGLTLCFAGARILIRPAFRARATTIFALERASDRFECHRILTLARFGMHIISNMLRRCREGTHPSVAMDDARRDLRIRKNDFSKLGLNFDTLMADLQMLIDAERQRIVKR